MGGPTITPYVYEEKILKGKGQYTNQTTTEPLLMHGPSENKEEKKRPDRCGNHHETIRIYGRIPRSMNQHNTRVGKTMEQNTRQKGAYEILNVASRGRLQGSKKRRR